MKKPTFKIRLLEDKDYHEVVRIDEKVLKLARPDYYQQRFEKLFQSGEYVPTSLVAEDESGKVVGFIMGELYIGQYGITKEGAYLDTVGVDPNFQRQGIGEKLMDEFVIHLKELEVKKINTLVDKANTQMMRYFNSNRFQPSEAVINLERSI